MTVCIAAICDEKAVVGASDRMITAGGVVEYEPNETKIWRFTPSVLALVAGDILVHTEVYSVVFQIVQDRVTKEPDNWWGVKDVAELYSAAYSRLRQKRASREILERFGLNEEGFIKRQQELSPTFIKYIQEKLDAFDIGDIDAVITGVDKDGPHIYTVRNASITCQDSIGFSVIGIGERHAQLHFLLSGYTRRVNASKAFLIVHQAKRKSEVAPGVGKGTDMFAVGPQLGVYVDIERSWIEKMDSIYEENVKSTEQRNQIGEQDFLGFLKGQAEKTSQEQKIEPMNDKPEEMKK